jgi:carbonic anhydrase
MSHQDSGDQPDAAELLPSAAELIEHNRRVADTVKTPGMAAAPRRHVAVVTCMDARIDPLAELGLDIGEAHVIRNAGGVVTDDVIRSLSISQQKMGTREIVVVHHTSCGMCGLDETALRDQLEGRFGKRPEWPIGAFADDQTGLRDAIAALEASSFIEPDTIIFGFLYDIETGLLTDVALGETVTAATSTDSSPAT